MCPAVCNPFIQQALIFTLKKQTWSVTLGTLVFYAVVVLITTIDIFVFQTHLIRQVVSESTLLAGIAVDLIDVTVGNRSWDAKGT